MTHTTGRCVETTCEEPPIARGLCSRHYQSRRKDGSLVTEGNPLHHRLTRVVIEEKTATCSICGPTSIRVRTNKAHECMTVRKRNKNSPDSKMRYRLRTKYGITANDHRVMMADQCGRCAICDLACEKLVVDHNHETGQVRQLLCHGCNVAIGFLRDSAEIALAASRYLALHAPTRE
jgi:Pyruvate/2-oxoacid:ferredoxin oxidoreductase delta subunit